MNIEKLILRSLLLVVIFSAVSSFVVTAAFIPGKIDYDQSFKRPIEFAVSDTDPMKAASRLDKAASWMARHGYDKRNLCVFVYSPICDTSEFHRKLLEAAAELRSVEFSNPTERVLVMDNVRNRFVTRTSEGGETIGIPDGMVRTELAHGSKVAGWLLGAIPVFGIVVGFLGVYFWIESRTVR